MIKGRVYNPAFDVTDHELITAIITEHGVLREPNTESFCRVLEYVMTVE